MRKIYQIMCENPAARNQWIESDIHFVYINPHNVDTVSEETHTAKLRKFEMRSRKVHLTKITFTQGTILMTKENMKNVVAIVDSGTRMTTPLDEKPPTPIQVYRPDFEDQKLYDAVKLRALYLNGHDDKASKEEMENAIMVYKKSKSDEAKNLAEFTVEDLGEKHKFHTFYDEMGVNKTQ